MTVTLDRQALHAALDRLLDQVASPDVSFREAPAEQLAQLVLAPRVQLEVEFQMWPDEDWSDASGPGTQVYCEEFGLLFLIGTDPLADAQIPLPEQASQALQQALLQQLRLLVAECPWRRAEAWAELRQRGQRWRQQLGGRLLDLLAQPQVTTHRTTLRFPCWVQVLPEPGAPGLGFTRGDR